MIKRSYTIHQLILNDCERDNLQEMCSFALYKLKDKKYYFCRFTASQLIEDLYSGDFDEICILKIPEGMVERFIKMIHTVAAHPQAPSFAKDFERDVLKVLEVQA